MTQKLFDYIPSVLKDKKINYKVTRAVKYGKIPILNENWQNNPELFTYNLNHEKVVEHVNAGNNILLVCGISEKAFNIYSKEELTKYGLDGDETLYLVGEDFDNKEYYEKKKPFLNHDTLMWMSPSGNIHMIYWTDKLSKGVRVKQKNIDESIGKTLIDIQIEGKLLGMPPNEVIDSEKYGDSLPHKYKLLNDVKPAFMYLDDIETLFCDDKETIIIGDLQPKIEDNKPEFKVSDKRHQIRERVVLLDYLKSKGVTKKGSSKNYKCPFHSMTNKGNLTINFLDRTTKQPSNKAYCHDCKVIGDVVDWRAKIENISIKEAEDLFIKELNLDIKDERIEIELPREGRLISDFCKECGEILKTKNRLFFKQDTKKIVEIITNNENVKEKYECFSIVGPSRFITLIEEHIIPIVYVENKEIKEQIKEQKKIIKDLKKIESDEKQVIIPSKKIRMEYIAKPKSLSSEQAKTILASEEFEKMLPKIERIFKSPIPIIYEGKLTFPKKGYDERFNSWLSYDTPNIETSLSLGEATGIIKDILKDFSFRSKQDFSNAVAAILTPHIKGLLPKFTTRSPMFGYMGNRPGVGKGYLAALTSLIMEGIHINQPPVSTSDRKTDNSEELRKKITSAMIAGILFYVTDNNKGHMDSPVLEAAITSEKWEDRLLGENISVVLNNELIYGFTGNINLTLSPDLQRRTKIIYLHSEVENIDSRKFSRPNLHEWVVNNRGLILSAIYTLIRNWFEKGCLKSKLEYNGFPEWGRICGGIMETAGYTSPCNPDEGLIIGTDPETEDMKTLFETAYETYGEKWITKQQLQDLIFMTDAFTYIDFSKRSDQISFGKKLSRFVGRDLSNIFLTIKDPKMRASRQEFMFTKELQKGLDTHIFDLEVTNPI